MSGERRCPACGQLIRTTLSPREASQLRWLGDNPGSWGGPLDRGQKQGDPEIIDWVVRGLIELQYVRGQWGYYLTAAGRASLDGGPHA